LLHRSVYGRWLYAVGKNEEAARFSGISTNIVIATAYIISGGLAGVSTVLFVFYTNSVSPSSFGNFYELYAIAAAVLGGCSLRGGEGSILGICEYPGHPEFPELRGDGDGDSVRRAGGSATAGASAAQDRARRPGSRGAEIDTCARKAERVTARGGCVAGENGRQSMTDPSSS